MHILIFQIGISYALEDVFHPNRGFTSCSAMSSSELNWTPSATSRESGMMESRHVLISD
jgi:hypothetical protein